MVSEVPEVTLRAEVGATAQVGNAVADRNEQRERRTATGPVAVERIQDQQGEYPEGESLECELEPDGEHQNDGAPPQGRPARPSQYEREPAEQQSLQVNRVAQEPVGLSAIEQGQAR